MVEHLNSVLTGVGPRLRALRQHRDMTLEQLAAQTEISVSTLSRLESGQRKPTLELLLPLAQTYRVPLDELVGAPATGDPRVHPRAVQRDGKTWVQLARNPGGLNAFKQILPVQPARYTAKELCEHEGYEWIYVLRGRLRLVLGDAEYNLTTGEAAEFDSSTKHGYFNIGNEPLELLTILGGQGARVHLKISPRECIEPN